MRIIVTGLVASYPVGGVAWDYLQYVQGFRALGCDVYYLEDTGQWLYDPTAETFTADAAGGARYLGACLAHLDPALARAWALRAPDGTLLGMEEAALERLCADTDLFLNLSGSCWLRDAYRGARVKAYVDTDPGYSQAKLAAADAGMADESVQLPVLGSRIYGGKDVEFLRFLDLPGRTAETLEVALSGNAPRERIAAAGWHVVEARRVSATMDTYRDYILASRGECSIAKNAYVALRSGWFSTRSAAYLACGKPVVVQETGFSAHVPPGPGLHPFSTAEGAVAGLAAIRADYTRASAHARALAETAFEARRVLGRLIADAGL